MTLHRLDPRPLRRPTGPREVRSRPRVPEGPYTVAAEAAEEPSREFTHGPEWSREVARAPAWEDRAG